MIMHQSHIYNSLTYYRSEVWVTFVLLKTKQLKHYRKELCLNIVLHLAAIFDFQLCILLWTLVTSWRPQCPCSWEVVSLLLSASVSSVRSPNPDLLVDSTRPWSMHHTDRPLQASLQALQNNSSSCSGQDDWDTLIFQSFSSSNLD